jgi:inosine triphosphate pyrophosphatase
MATAQEHHKKLTFLTGNANKLSEIKQILSGVCEVSFENSFFVILFLQVQSIDVDLPEYQGDPDEVARAKCLAAVAHVKAPVIIEDTCLCFEALGGK